MSSVQCPLPIVLERGLGSTQLQSYIHETNVEEKEREGVGIWKWEIRSSEVEGHKYDEKKHLMYLISFISHSILAFI